MPPLFVLKPFTTLPPTTTTPLPATTTLRPARYYNGLILRNANCVPGNVVPGGGVPTSYDSTLHGDIIWVGNSEDGYVGTSFVPVSEYVSITLTCDNEFILYVNQQTVGQGADWSVFNRYNVVPVDRFQTNTITIYVKNWSGSRGVVATINNPNGSLIVKTSTSWRCDNGPGLTYE